MKTVFCSLTLLLLLSCGHPSKKAEESPRKQVSEKPIALIQFPEGMDYNFGSYYEKDTVRHDFLVHNPGTVPLVISKVEASCSCTLVTYPQKPILEGQTDTIHVAYDGNGFVEGIWYKSIRVYANIANESRDLTIRGAYYDNNDNTTSQ